MKNKSIYLPVLILIAVVIWILYSCGYRGGYDAASPLPVAIVEGHQDKKVRLTDEQKSREMPLPGQVNDHSTLDSNSTKKGE